MIRLKVRAEHYNYFRDYDPAIGRYIESDPIGLKGGLNTYGYVNGVPLTRFDRYGLESYYNPMDGTYIDPDAPPQPLYKPLMPLCCSPSAFGRCTREAFNNVNWDRLKDWNEIRKCAQAIATRNPISLAGCGLGDGGMAAFDCLEKSCKKKFVCECSDITIPRGAT